MHLSLDNSHLWRFVFHFIFSHLRAVPKSEVSSLSSGAGWMSLSQPGASRVWYLGRAKAKDGVPSRKGGKAGETSSVSM